MEPHPKLKEHVINATMKILKIISVISFLFIEGIQLHGSLNFAILLLYLYQFIHDILKFSQSHDIFWEGSLAIPIIGTLITLFFCKTYKDRYLLLFCFFVLLFAILILTGITYPENHERILSVGFIPALSIFIISSFWLIILNFKKPAIENDKY